MQTAKRKLMWQGRELHTIGDIMDALGACATAHDARTLMIRYRRTSFYADENVTHASGRYWDDAKRARMLGWIGLSDDAVHHAIWEDA